MKKMEFVKLQTEAVKKLGHKYILTKRDAPTCESDGVLYGKCSRCSKTITSSAKIQH